MSPVVQITAGHSVIYYPDGYTRTGYDDQEYYDVPTHVARGMVERGWAKLVSSPPTEPQPRQPPEPEPPPPPVKEPTPSPEPPKPADDDEDEDGDKPEDAKSLLRTKKRR